LLNLTDDSYDFNGRVGAGWVTNNNYSDSDDGPELRILYHLGDQTSVNSTFNNSSTATIANTLGAGPIKIRTTMITPTTILLYRKQPPWKLPRPARPNATTAVKRTATRSKCKSSAARACRGAIPRCRYCCKTIFRTSVW